MRSVRALWLWMVCAGCVNHVAFRPREYVDSESPDGVPAASYRVEHGGRTSEVRVWTTGVERGGGRTTVRVEFEVENGFADSVAIDDESVGVERIELEEGALDALERVSIEGESRTGPAEVGIAGFVFAFPDEVGPADVRSFTVRWALAEPVVFEQRTAFRRALEPRVRGYYEYGFPLFYYRHRRGYGACLARPWL